MKWTGQLALLFAIATLASSCASVTVSNREIFNDRGKYGAKSFRVLTSHERTLSKAEWDKKRFGMFCMDAEALAEINVIRETFCEDYGRCTYDFEIKADEVMTKVNRLDVESRRMKGAGQ